MSKHFILDYETIGQDVFRCPTVNCSYFIFEWDRFTSDNPYSFDELVESIAFRKFDIKSQMQAGRSYKKADLDWWMGNEKAKEQLKPSSIDTPVSDFPAVIENYLKGTRIFRWWSRSNTFDPILLHRDFAEFSSRELLDSLLPFWLVRDIRTHIDSQFEFQIKKNGFCPLEDEEEWNSCFIPHNSVHDVAADILRLQRIERAKM